VVPEADSGGLGGGRWGEASSSLIDGGQYFPGEGETALTVAQFKGPLFCSAALELHTMAASAMEASTDCLHNPASHNHPSRLPSHGSLRCYSIAPVVDRNDRLGGDLVSNDNFTRHCRCYRAVSQAQSVCIASHNSRKHCNREFQNHTYLTRHEEIALEFVIFFRREKEVADSRNQGQL